METALPIKIPGKDIRSIRYFSALCPKFSRFSGCIVELSKAGKADPHAATVEFALALRVSVGVKHGFSSSGLPSQNCNLLRTLCITGDLQ